MDLTEQQWLEKSTRIPGVLAYGAGRTQESMVVYVHAPELPKPPIARVCYRLVECMQQISAEHYAGQQFIWSFENLQILCVHRTDQTLLVLFLKQDISATEFADVQHICREFSQNG